MLAGLLAAGMLVQATPWFYAGLAAALVHALWQVRQLRDLTPSRAGVIFRSNQYLGLLIFVALLIGRAWA